MRLTARKVAAAALIFAAAGCGFGSGPSEGTADLTVTRDYGAERILQTGEEVPSSETVMRLLDRSADIETRYGGKFVQSIDGISGGERDGRRVDWFFYVNGVESPVGAAEYDVEDGDRIWWDHRDWSSAMRVPGVVGSWPEPFSHGFEGDTYGTRIDCLAATQPCEATREALANERVEAGIFESKRAPGFDAEARPTLRILVGPWERVRADPAATQIEKGPAQSGVFARFQRAGSGFALAILDERGEVVDRLTEGAGLVSAVRFENQPPVWVVTGTDEAGVTSAAGLLDQSDLRDRYAVAVGPDGETVPVPAR